MCEKILDVKVKISNGRLDFQKLHLPLLNILCNHVGW